MSNSLQPHGLECSRFHCPSQYPVVCSDSCPLSLWCHSTILASITPFSSCPQSFPASGSFPVSQLFTSHSSSQLFTWPKYWSFSFSISLSNEYSGLISFRMDWFDFLAVQATLKSLFQHHNLKASILQCSAFFICINIIWQRTPALPIWLGERLEMKSEHMHYLTALEPTHLPYWASLKWVRCMLLQTWHNRSTWPSVKYFRSIKKNTWNYSRLCIYPITRNSILS